MSEDYKNKFKQNVPQIQKPKNKIHNNDHRHRNQSAGPTKRNNYNKDKRSRSSSPVAQSLNSFMIKKHDKIGRPELVELEIMNAESIIIFFSKNTNAFEQLLTDVSNLDIIILFLRVISKICSSSFQEYKNEIIIQIWLKGFLEKLRKLISELVSEKKSARKSTIFFWEDQNRFWNDLLILYKTIFEIVPRTASETLLSIIKMNQTAIHEISTNKHGSNSKNFLIELDKLKEKIVIQREQQSFRNISIFPTAKEITTKEIPFIRSNISEGSFSSVEIYLDTHFRLLREDYVRSLRNNICAYLENQRKLNVYENVQFIQPVVTYDKVCILVKLNSNMYSNDNKFKHGSLLCFSKDNFQTVAYGTLVLDDKTKSEFSSNGCIIVDLIDTIIYNENYVMVSNNSSADTTIQILKALQNMKEKNFPLKQYIVDANKQIGYPKYLIEAVNKRKKSKKQIESTVNEDDQYYQLFSKNTVRSADDFKLNSAQYKAFQTALTKELSIIQGPPGTGKTYTTLKIVECLLKNKRILKYIGPILVICYTNHALDQFLEGILPFCKDIIRVGKDSENPKINNLNLRNQRWRSNNDRYSHSRELLETEKEKIDQVKQKIQCLQNLLEDLRSGTGILNFKLFKNIDDKLENTWFDYANPEDILQWLMVDLNAKNIFNPVIDMSSTKLNTTNSTLYSKTDGNVRDTKIIDDNKLYDSDEDLIDNCILTIPKIKENIESLKHILFNMKTALNFIDSQKYEKAIRELEMKQIYLQKRLNDKKLNTELFENINYNFPQRLTADIRWALYHNWVHLLHLQVYQDIAVLDEKYREHKRRHQEIQHMIDVCIMNEKAIIGMTTSKAASLQPLLQTLKCKIVIVEEAAEVLESHIVAALTNHCQQLILIGDHLQLRPSINEHKLAKDFNLELSLFERMINNGIPYHQLEVQHRMRPEFAELITPSIYSNLQNDESVKHFPPVRGISKNLFFVSHKTHEDRIRNSTSLKNTFEVKYIIKLAVYLIKQDYKTDEITILATYKKQMEALESESKLYPELQNMRIATVDNFQGEENKIILLSLVRSNEKENIGFLKIENRVCVALSRAKEGFYIVGNMESFEKSSNIWPKVIEVLTRQNAIGPALMLKCQLHNNEIRVENYTDFDKVVEGGCNAKCGEKLSCGHTCKLSCHNYDRDHKQYACKERCNKILCDRNHKCPKLCSDSCDKCMAIVEKCLPCGHFQSLLCSDDPWEYKCVELKNVSLSCNHKMQIECHENTLNVICPYKCGEQLKCGHKCQKPCHVNNPSHEQYVCKEQCNKILCENNHKCRKLCSNPCDKCIVIIEKRLPCSHFQSLPCSDDPRKYKCVKLKHVTLPCKHKAQIKCNESILNVICSRKCGTVLNCGHKCKKTCHINNPNHEEYKCNETCGRVLPCNHFCKNLCFMPCGGCEALVEKVVPNCGHKIKIKCNIEPEVKYCNNPCSRTLICGHGCQKRCKDECVCINRCDLQYEEPSCCCIVQ